MDFQSLFPVYLARAKEKDERTEDYNTSVATNQNNLNQNLNILFNGLTEMAGTIDALAARIAALEGGN